MPHGEARLCHSLTLFKASLLPMLPKQTQLQNSTLAIQVATPILSLLTSAPIQAGKGATTMSAALPTPTAAVSLLSGRLSWWKGA